MIKAIETKYKGYRFRSRLEARWAVFFDAMSWEWEYEPEGFDLGNGIYYLPDFKIFGIDSNGDNNVFYIEVKAKDKNLSDQEKRKILTFANMCHDKELIKGYGDFILLDGTPDEISYLSAGAFVDPNGWGYEPLWWAMDVIYRHGRPTFDWFGRYGKKSRKFAYLETKQDFRNDGYIGLSPIEKSRSARFEHGDSPL